MKLKSQIQVNLEETRGLTFARRGNVNEKNQKKEP